jgi:hypothetical protein
MRTALATGSALCFLPILACDATLETAPDASASELLQHVADGDTALESPLTAAMNGDAVDGGFPNGGCDDEAENAYTLCLDAGFDPGLCEIGSDGVLEACEAREVTSASGPPKAEASAPPPAGGTSASGSTGQGSQSVSPGISQPDNLLPLAACAVTDANGNILFTGADEETCKAYRNVVGGACTVLDESHESVMTDAYYDFCDDAKDDAVSQLDLGFPALDPSTDLVYAELRTECFSFPLTGGIDFKGVASFWVAEYDCY